MHSIEKIVGQKRAVRMLKGMIASGRIPVCMIFSGPEGVGKSSTARAFAFAVSCQKGSGCGECPACRLNECGDGFREIDVAALMEREKSKAAAFRRELSSLSISRDLARMIVVITSAELLTDVMQAAMLKAIEEPPAGVSYVLVTSLASALSATINSRSVRIRFAPLSDGEIEEVISRHGDLKNRGRVRDLLPYASGSVSRTMTLLRDNVSMSDIERTLLDLGRSGKIPRAELLARLRNIVPLVAVRRPEWRENLIRLDQAVAENANVALAFSVFESETRSHRRE